MATVTLSQVYEPLTFQEGVDEMSLELNAFVQSGVLVESPRLSAMASVGGRTGDVPFGKPFDSIAEPNYVSDDPTSFSVPNNIDTGLMTWRLAAQHNSWSAMDLSRELALFDPLGKIIARVSHYWAAVAQHRVVSSALAIYLDSVANYSGDMVVDIYSDIAVPAAANILGADSIIDALQTSGDHRDVYTAIGMHSASFTALEKADLIDTIRDSEGSIIGEFYRDLQVIIDDSLIVIAGVNSPAYITILFGRGAFDLGNGNTLEPTEEERIASSGDGGGESVVHSRISAIYHPIGYTFLSTTVAGYSPTWAELEDAGNWGRVYDRKNVALAFVKHNV